VALLFNEANGRRGQGCTDKAANTLCSIVIQKTETASAALLHFQSLVMRKFFRKIVRGALGYCNSRGCLEIDVFLDESRRLEFPLGS
jgi:hypothetical protein